MVRQAKVNAAHLGSDFTFRFLHVPFDLSWRPDDLGSDTRGPPISPEVSGLLAPLSGADVVVLDGVDHPSNEWLCGVAKRVAGARVCVQEAMATGTPPAADIDAVLAPMGAAMNARPIRPKAGDRDGSRWGGLPVLDISPVAFANALGGVGGPRVALWAGRLEPAASPALFVDACLLGRIECWVVGEGPLRGRLEAMALARGGNVTFWESGGAPTDKRSVVHVSTAFDAVFEPAALDAMVHALACLAFAVPSLLVSRALERHPRAGLEALTAHRVHFRECEFVLSREPDAACALWCCRHQECRWWRWCRRFFAMDATAFLRKRRLRNLSLRPWRRLW
jgi:hypothetical protein